MNRSTMVSLGKTWDNRNGSAGAGNTMRTLTHLSGTSREGLPDMVPKICSFEGCGRPKRAFGLCSGHVTQKQRGQSLHPLRARYSTLSELLDGKVIKSESCWEWAGTIGRDGYGRQRWEGYYWLTHRLAYTHHRGAIPDGLLIDHICQNPPCVNPDHLRLATQKQNGENLSGVRAASGYRGVIRERKGPSWRAEVKHNGKLHSRYGFPTAEAANEAAIELRRDLFTHNNADWSGHDSE